VREDVREGDGDSLPVEDAEARDLTTAVDEDVVVVEESDTLVDGADDADVEEGKDSADAEGSEGSEDGVGREADKD
jgi:hypothetical protein